MRTATIETRDGPMIAHLATPEGAGPFPAVVVVQEAYGVNGHIVDVCARFARKGFLAIAPEFFHRIGEHVVFGYDEVPKLMPIFGRLTNDTLEVDVVAVLDWLRRQKDVDAARVGIVGFCMGGFVSFLAACRADVRSAVCFYGGGIVKARPNIGFSPLIDEVEKIRAPLLMFFGENDQGIPLEQVDTIRRTLEAHAKTHEIVVVPGAGHGFFCEQRASHHAEGAKLAWEGTIDWLRATMA